MYAIAKIKSLKVLDFAKIKTAERQAAESWLASPAGAALEGQTVKSFVPGEGLDETARSFAATTFSAEEKELIDVIGTLERAIGIIEKEMSKGASMMQLKNVNNVVEAL